MMNDYWGKRYEELMNRAIHKGDKLNERLDKIYAQELAKITQLITAWHRRYARANNVTLAEARKRLQRKEAEELQWTVAEYIKNGSADNLTGTIKLQLENASINYHITRLQALQTQMIMHINDLYTREEQEIRTTLGEVLQSSYTRSLYEQERIRKKLDTFSTLPRDEVERMLGTAYASDGLNFSERTWKNRDKLIQEVEQVITTGLIRGRNSQRESRELASRIYDELQINDITERMADKWKNASRASKRIIITESSFFANEGVAKSCAELDIDKYQLIATLDTRTSSICQTMDLQVFNFSEKKTGVNYPPFHPHCRTVAAPYDEYKDESETRIARDKNGRNIYIPHDMTYKEWYNKYITEEQDTDLSETEPNSDGSNKPLTKNTEIKQAIKGYEKPIRDTINNAHVSTTKTIWNKYEDKLKVATLRPKKGAYFSPGEGIAINLAKDKAREGKNEKWATFFHENGHQIDFLARIDQDDPAGLYFSATYNHGAFRKSIEADWEVLLARLKQADGVHAVPYWKLDADGKPKKGARKRMNWKRAEAILYDEIVEKFKADGKERRAKDTVSDIITGLTKNKIRIGGYHSNSYWNEDWNNVTYEAFAEFYSASVRGGKELEIIKEYFPKAYITFMDMLEELSKDE